MPYHQRTTDTAYAWIVDKLKLLPVALAVISLIGFLFVLSARVTSLEAEEKMTSEDIKEINESITEIKVKSASMEEKVNSIKEDTNFIKQRLK